MGGGIPIPIHSIAWLPRRSGRMGMKDIYLIASLTFESASASASAAHTHTHTPAVSRTWPDLHTYPSYFILALRLVVVGIWARDFLGGLVMFDGWWKAGEDYVDFYVIFRLISGVGR